MEGKTLNMNPIIQKADFSDFTFLMPLRIDSTERKENADTVVRFIFQYFSTSFIVLEADSEQRYFPEFNDEGFRYEFVNDNNEIYRKTIWINRLLTLTNTPFVAIWDADAIAPPEQIIKSAEELRTSRAVMSLPYDGRFYSADKISCDLFKRLLNIEILNTRIEVMDLLYSYRAVGGAYMANREKFIKAGGENENFIGWGPEDYEHVKRMEVLGLPVHYANGPLFHLWHQRGKNSMYANKEIEIHNRKVLLDTCKINNQ
jgi:predicted glycosyltransferase involved in capsule biosynthesis